MPKKKKTPKAGSISWTEAVTKSSSSDGASDSGGVPVPDESVRSLNEWDSLPPEEFIIRFREAASEYIDNAYITDHPLRYSAVSGVVTSSLCEDVFSLINMQWNVLHDYLKSSRLLGTDLGDNIIVDCLLCLFRNLLQKHLEYRNSSLVDLDYTCATANDYYRMMETAEEFWATLQQTYPRLFRDKDRASVLHRELSDLLSLYSSDAVYEVQRAHALVVREINESDISTELFSRDWEDVYTNNEVVLSLINTMEDFLSDFHNFLSNDLLFRKVVDSLVRAVVCFYVTCLVRKADQARRHKKRKNKNAEPFYNPARAVVRMMYDLHLLRTYFENLTKQIPSLAVVVDRELSVLVLLHECLGVAVGSTGTSSLEEFVIVLHKHTGGNLNVTKHLMGDLWLLAAPPSQRNEIYTVVGMMQAELQLLSMRMDEKASSVSTHAQQQQRDPLKGIKLIDTLKDFYEERMLQEQFSVCAPCVQAIKTNHKKREARKAATLPETSKLLGVPIEEHPSNNPDQFLLGLQEKLTETLKLHNIGFVKKLKTTKSPTASPTKFEFTLTALST